MTDQQRPRLTSRQQAVLTFMRRHVAELGYPPSIREIGREVGLKSTSSVHHVLRALDMKGYVQRSPEKVRALTLLHAEPQRCTNCGHTIEQGGTA